MTLLQGATTGSRAGTRLGALGLGALRMATLPLAALAIGAPTLAAQETQVTGSLDVGAATVAYDEFLRSSVATLSPLFRVEHGRATFVARGAYSRFLETGNYSIEGTLAASVFSPAVWKIRGELYGTASNTRYSKLGDSAATNLLTAGRLHLASADRGLWLGTGLGVVTQGFNFPDDLVQLDVGGWLRSGETVITGQALPTRIGSRTYTDVIAGARWSPQRAELTLSAGYRLGEHATGATRWAELGGAYWFTPHLALVGGGGVFPTELWRGLPGGSYASAAVRVATRGPRTYDPQRSAELMRPYELGPLRKRPAVARRFLVTTEPDGTRSLRIRVPGADRVELMGDFTDWTPVRLVPSTTDDDEWQFNVFISPGVHRVNIRINGGEWVAPPGLTVLRDEFGGQVGLLIVQ